MAPSFLTKSRFTRSALKRTSWPKRPRMAWSNGDLCENHFENFLLKKSEKTWPVGFVPLEQLHTADLFFPEAQSFCRSWPLKVSSLRPNSHPLTPPESKNVIHPHTRAKRQIQWSKRPQKPPAKTWNLRVNLNTSTLQVIESYWIFLLPSKTSVSHFYSLEALHWDSSRVLLKALASACLLL